MFLDSTYQPQAKPALDDLNIYDIAILAAQMGDRPFLRRGLKKHLTAGNIQLACYVAQGRNMVKTGRSLFKDDFYVLNNRIESPKITELFGSYDKVVTPFTMTEAIKALLTPINRGFETDTNLLCQMVIDETVSRDYKEFMKALRETKPYTEALHHPFKKIEKANIKQYFESLILTPTQIEMISIGEENV